MNPPLRTLVALFCTAWVGASADAVGAEPPVTSQASPEPRSEPTVTKAPYNFPSKTMGGIQFWTDQRVHRDWRIQSNFATGHSRLLDPSNVRRAWGSYEQCNLEFQRRAEAGDVKPLAPRVVLLLHGLMGRRGLLEPLQDHLRDQGLDAMCMTYASTRYSVEDHSNALKEVIDRLGPGVKRIDFVCHSMGNIVLRHYLGGLKVGSPRQKQIGHVVMLAPPNRGAEIAKILKDNAMFQLITGESGQQLGDFQRLEKKLSVPWTPFGIVAGGGSGRNPVLEGDDDLFVKIEETKLPGAADFMVVDSMHRTLPKSPKVMEVTYRFLEKGYFVSEQRRMRLPRATPR